MKKILVALSGGVDSSVAAFLLKEAGYEVSGAYIKTWMNEGGKDLFAHCPWEEDIQYAEASAKHIGIDFAVINLIQDYRERVVKYLVEGYRSGITPNPDIMCNREMKFGVFLDHALHNGFDGIATGHYCRKAQNTNGSFDILEGVDKNKDQSYFLALLKQHQLAKALFPIGEFKKPMVRELAKKAGLPNANKKDSQGICFLGKISINQFLREYIDDNPGPIVNSDGKTLGQHKGLHHFTIGQRKGIGVPSNTDYENYVVVAKNYDTNELVVAFESPTAPGLYTYEVNLRHLSFINKTPRNGALLAKPRYRDPSQEIALELSSSTVARVMFKQSQRALARGQLLGLYEEEKLLGGGIYF